MSKMCPLIYNGIATDPSGGYGPCCRFKTGYIVDNYIIISRFHGKIKQYRTSELWKRIEKDFLDDKFHPGCWDCEKNEDANGTSKRLREIRNYKAKYKKDNLDTDHLKNIGYDLIDLRLSNKCNLGCLTCNPKSSSLINTEVKNANDHMEHYKNIYHWAKDQNLATPYDDKDLEHLLDTIQLGSRVYFTGGEPSVIKGVLTFLQSLIDNKLNKDITIEFNSNFQTGNPKFINLLSYFPKGLMMPSIDGVGIRAEYIRYPSNWKQIESNIALFTKSCPDWMTHFTPIISTLNIFYLDELIDFCNKHNYMLRFTNILHGPDYFNITTLPEKYKKLAIEKLKNIKNISCLNTEAIPMVEKYIYSKDTDLSLLRSLKNNLIKSDAIRNIDYKKHLPILEEIFECL